MSKGPEGRFYEWLAGKARACGSTRTDMRKLSARGVSGLPDVYAWGPGGAAAWIELKAQGEWKGRPRESGITALQARNLRVLHEADHHALLVVKTGDAVHCLGQPPYDRKMDGEPPWVLWPRRDDFAEALAHALSEREAHVFAFAALLGRRP